VLYLLLFIILSLNGVAVNEMDLARRMKATSHISFLHQDKTLIINHCIIGLSFKTLIMLSITHQRH